MVQIREAPIRPLDLILFRGVDFVSRAICFVESKKLGRGDYSHVGVAITRDVLDLPFLEPGRIYVWESTFSAKAGFFARFTDKVPDLETEGVRFGVQIRDLELIVPGYTASGGEVAWCAFRGARPSSEAVRPHLQALHQEFGHVPYTHHLLDLFGVVYPALRPARDRLHRAEDRLAHFLNEVLPRARIHRTFEDSEHHLFCSEWVGIVYQRLGLTPSTAEPHQAAPVTPLLHPELFEAPVILEARAEDERSG